MAWPKGKPRPPGAGRTAGTPNRNTAELKDMILAALHGAGGQEYLEYQAKRNPAAFLSLVGRVLPKDMNITSPATMIVSLNGQGIAPPT